MSIFNGWGDYLPTLLQGLWVSVKVTAAALVIGLPIGLLLALGSGSSNKLVKALTIALVELGRGTPSLVVLQIFYFGMPGFGVTLSSFISAAIAFSLTTAAYTSEIIRGGLQAVPAGEVEAADALGMSNRDTLRYIIVPQGLRVAMPPLIGFGVLIFQASSLAYTIALPELLGQAYSIGSTTFQYLSVLTLAGLLYAAVTIPASLLTDRVQARMSRHLTRA